MERLWPFCGLLFDQDDRWGSRRFEPTNLSFCKSVFAVDGMLYSLGTDIEAKGDYSDEWITATNLFQSIVSKESGDMTVNGQIMKAGKEQIIEPQVAAWMVTPTTIRVFCPERTRPVGD